MQVAFFEDRLTPQLFPLTMLRPACELVCGHWSLRERVLRTWPVSAWGVFLRDLLRESYREQFPEAHLNESQWLEQESTLFINARWLPSASELSEIAPDSAGVIDDTLVYVTLSPHEATSLTEIDCENVLYQLARGRRRVKAAGRLVAWPWDLVEANPLQLERDFRELTRSTPHSTRDEKLTTLGSLDNLRIDPAAEVEPFVVIDARKGPVSIEAGAIVQPFSRIEGPCHIGQRALICSHANIRGGTTIGPECRIGGEVEASICLAYVNKYHSGFLGHSYVCPWVNLGAQTTNSDMKNDYSSVRVPINGELVDSGLRKVGCFIGDHSKTGLGSLFNTGTAVGVMSMILPAGGLLPRYIPPFSSVWHGELSAHIPLERSLLAARIVMERRNCELTSAQQRLLRTLYQQTSDDREAAITRFHNRKQGESPLPV